MPESSNSSNSRDLNNYLNKKLRKDATILRSLIEKGASAEKVQKNKKQCYKKFIISVIPLGTYRNL